MKSKSKGVFGGCLLALVGFIVGFIAGIFIHAYFVPSTGRGPSHAIGGMINSGLASGVLGVIIFFVLNVIINGRKISESMAKDEDIDIDKEYNELKKLRDNTSITEEEYQSRRSRLISSEILKSMSNRRF